MASPRTTTNLNIHIYYGKHYATLRRRDRRRSTLSLKMHWLHLLNRPTSHRLLWDIYLMYTRCLGYLMSTRCLPDIDSTEMQHRLDIDLADSTLSMDENHRYNILWKAGLIFIYVLWCNIALSTDNLNHIMESGTHL